MFKFWKKSSTQKVFSKEEKQDVKNAAIAIKSEIGCVLENDEDDAAYDRIYSLMNLISRDVYNYEKVLGYGLSDAGKFLTDIDIRKKDKDYDGWWREKLSNYLNEIDEIILKYST